MVRELVAVEQLDSVSVTRTAVQRRERSVWDITITRSGREVAHSTTLHELAERLRGERLQREVYLTEVELAKFNQTPPPSPEEPDPDWVDLTAVAQANLDGANATIHDLEYLIGLLEEGGES